MQIGIVQFTQTFELQKRDLQFVDDYHTSKFKKALRSEDHNPHSHDQHKQEDVYIIDMCPTTLVE